MQSVNLAYECFGEQKSQSPLLILHGFLASSRNWRSIAKQLSEHRQVYVPDLRNHGASPHHPHMSYPDMAGDVNLLLDSLGIEKAHILGHSMGGKVAMWMALQQSQRIDKLLVADIAPVSYPHRFDCRFDALAALPLCELGNRKQAEEFLAASIPELLERQFLLQNLIFQDGVYRWRINLDIFRHNAALIAAFPVLDGIPPYIYPCLFLAGEASPYVQIDAVQRWFPGAKIDSISGAGHWLHVDAPAVLCRKINDWLSCSSVQ